MRRRGLVLVLLLGLVTPVSAQAKARPGAPKQKVVLRAITGVAKATTFASGRAAATRARRAFARKKYCNAASALSTHHGRVAAALRKAKRRRARGQVRRLRALDARSVRARLLVLRSLPQGKACGGPTTVAVDQSLKPTSKLPAIGGSGARPMARLVDAYGHAVDFVANEAIVNATSDAALRQVVKRWKGKVLATVDLTRIGGKGKQALVRVNVSRADTGRLAADIAALSKTRGGAELVSSDQGMALLAAAARQTRSGTDVGINFVSQGTAIAAGTSLEAATGADGFSTLGPGYSPDAFNWKHLAGGTTQNVGVAPAWQLMARSGRSANRIGLAVLDMGFAPETNGPDFGPIVHAISNVPFTSALGTPNLLSCGGGFSCPWHGTGVANTAFAIPDNGLGVAGTGGQVADRIVVFTLYDFFTSISAVIEAGAAGARVVNMSYGADVPAAFSWTVLPFELTTGVARAAGMLMFAAAGNSNTDVDAEDCFIVCWEETLWTPCENVGVFCVGALDHDSKNRASYSNWGRSGVDLFAPGSVLVGLDPATPTGPGRSGVHQVNGTSVASPFLAGVAALVWAANPSASADDVERALKETAHTSDDGRVRRYVHALAAVKRLLPRVVRLEQPVEGSSFRRGTTVTLSAFVYDDDLGVPTSVNWRLADGTVVGAGATLTVNTLPYGAQQLTATAVFPDGASESDRVNITLTNDAPTVEIQQPSDGSTFFQGENVTVLGQGRDVNQVESSFRLRNEQIGWFLDAAATPFGTGESTTLDLTGVPTGTHTITLRGTDDASATATASIQIQVDPAPPNLPPSVAITSPTNNQSFLAQGPDGTGKYYADVNFQANASDPESDPLTYSWTEKVNNGPAVVRSTVQDPGTQRIYTPDGCPSTHDWTLAVSDGTSTRTATVRVTINIPC